MYVLFAGTGIGRTALPHDDHLYAAGTASKAIQICPPCLSPAAGFTRVRCHASSNYGDDSQNGYDDKFEDTHDVQ